MKKAKNADGTGAKNAAAKVEPKVENASQGGAKVEMAAPVVSVAGSSSEDETSSVDAQVTAPPASSVPVAFCPKGTLMITRLSYRLL